MDAADDLRRMHIVLGEVRLGDNAPVARLSGLGLVDMGVIGEMASGLGEVADLSVELVQRRDDRLREEGLHLLELGAALMVELNEIEATVQLFRHKIPP